jgi:hypothetical protein
MEIDSFQSHKFFENRFRNIYYFQFIGAYPVVNDRESFADEIYVLPPKKVNVLVNKIRQISVNENENLRIVRCYELRREIHFYVMITSDEGDYILECADETAAGELLNWIERNFGEVSDLIFDFGDMDILDDENAVSILY